MRYMGSKRRYIKQILPIILKDREPNQWYVEPFVGGGNVISAVDGNRIGADSNKYVIATLDAISRGWLPMPSYTEEQYNFVKLHRDNDPVLTGYMGTALSFAGKWFGGWSRGADQDYCGAAYRSAIKHCPKLAGVKFFASDYRTLVIPEKSVIYCDPPYAGHAKYSNKFDSSQFWIWAARMATQGHTLYVSEYTAPPSWSCVWQKESVSTVSRYNYTPCTERLFTYNGK